MKIVYIHQYFNTPIMNGSTRSFEFARRLVESGHEVHIITSIRSESNHTFPKWQCTLEEGIIVHWLPVSYNNKMNYARRIFSFIKFAFYSTLKSLKINADLIFATSTPLTVAIPAIVVSKLKRIPFIFEVRDLWPEIPIALKAIKNPAIIFLSRLLEKIAYKNSEAIIALSPGMLEGIKKIVGTKKKSYLIPNSCDISIFSSIDRVEAKSFLLELGLPESRKVVLYAGTFGRINGVNYLVNLASQMALVDSTICFLLVGDGLEFSQVVEEAARLDVLNKNVFICPGLPKLDVAKLFVASDMVASVFVDLPEMRANSANKFFDGLASGKPLLINYGGWHHELINDYGCGLGLHNLTFESAADAILGMFHDAARYNTACNASLKIAHELFDRDKLAKNFEAILLDVYGVKN